MVHEKEQNDLIEGNSPRFRTIEAYVTGKVQAVGFRACVKNVASHLSVTGEVMNLEDGRVCIIATAEDIIIDKFISSLYECPRAHIRDIHIYKKELREFPDFSIIRIY